MWFEDFQDGSHGGHLSYRCKTIFAILNHYVPSMPPTMQKDLLFGRRGSLNYFSDSESLCRFDASHQVSAQSDVWFGRRCRLKNFKMAAMATILDIGMYNFSQF